LALISYPLIQRKKPQREKIVDLGYKCADSPFSGLNTKNPILPTIDPIANHLLGGLFGAAAGVMGAYFSGGIVGLTVGSGNALPYRNRLNSGKYLIIVKGTGELTRQAALIIRQFEPENIQGYTEPAVV
jgi:hypothetical protein